MSQADEDSWPLGFSCHVEFDFDKALAYIKDQLEPEFMKNEWTCHAELTEAGEEDAHLFVQITFLDLLWECLLFQVGHVKGPSPWKSVRCGLEPGTLYAEDDAYLGYEEMLAASGDESTDEEVLDFLRHGFDLVASSHDNRFMPESLEQMSEIFQDRIPVYIPV
ncbi:hypothetical protein LQW54_003084 [Pestalotiopsis sp. IQ-011]